MMMKAIEKIEHYMNHSPSRAASALKNVCLWKQDMQEQEKHGFDGFGIREAEQLVADGRYIVRSLHNAVFPLPIILAMKNSRYIEEYAMVVEKLAEEVIDYNAEGCVFDAEEG